MGLLSLRLVPELRITVFDVLIVYSFYFVKVSMSDPRVENFLQILTSV